MAPYNPVPRTLWDLASSGLGTTLTVNGNSGTRLVDLLDVTDVWLSLWVTGTPTGTTPTLAAQVDIQDPDGNWFAALAKTTTVNAAAAGASAVAGLHMPNAASGSASVAWPLPRWCRVAWVLTGTTPVFPQTSICLTGR
jgi:hypothetical protein